jgi:hypothetical protein
VFFCRADELVDLAVADRRLFHVVVQAQTLEDLVGLVEGCAVAADLIHAESRAGVRLAVVRLVDRDLLVLGVQVFVLRGQRAAAALFRFFVLVDGNSAVWGAG